MKCFESTVPGSNNFCNYCVVQVLKLSSGYFAFVTCNTSPLPLEVNDCLKTYNPLPEKGLDGGVCCFMT